jgi:hypothetical protein
VVTPRGRSGASPSEEWPTESGQRSRAGDRAVWVAPDRAPGFLSVGFPERLRLRPAQPDRGIRLLGDDPGRLYPARGSLLPVECEVA